MTVRMMKKEKGKKRSAHKPFIRCGYSPVCIHSAPGARNHTKPNPRPRSPQNSVYLLPRHCCGLRDFVVYAKHSARFSDLRETSSGWGGEEGANWGRDTAEGGMCREGKRENMEWLMMVPY